MRQHAAAGSYTVSSALLEVDGVAAAALGSNIDEAGPKGDKKVATSLDTKTRRRLEQLDTTDESGTVLRLTQVSSSRTPSLAHLSRTLSHTLSHTLFIQGERHPISRAERSRLYPVYVFFSAAIV